MMARFGGRGTRQEARPGGCGVADPGTAGVRAGVLPRTHADAEDCAGRDDGGARGGAAPRREAGERVFDGPHALHRETRRLWPREGGRGRGGVHADGARHAVLHGARAGHGRALQRQVRRVEPRLSRARALCAAPALQCARHQGPHREHLCVPPRTPPARLLARPRACRRSHAQRQRLFQPPPPHPHKNILTHSHAHTCTYRQACGRPWRT